MARGNGGGNSFTCMELFDKFAPHVREALANAAFLYSEFGVLAALERNPLRDISYEIVQKDISVATREDRVYDREGLDKEITQRLTRRKGVRKRY